MLDAQVINVFTLSAINTFKQISDISLEKKGINIYKESMRLEAHIIKVTIQGDINGDILMLFNKNLSKKITEDFIGKFPELKNESSNSLEDSAFSEIGNILVSKITQYLHTLKKKASITQPVVIKDKEELTYESIAVVEMTTEYGPFSIGLGINEIIYQNNLSFLFYGLSEENIEIITSKLLPMGFEILSSKTPDIFLKYCTSKKIDVVVIDFYAVKPDLATFMKSMFAELKYKVSIIFGVTKVDALKIKSIDISTETYQIIGIYPKTYSVSQIIDHLLLILTKLGVKSDDRRRHIRVNITEPSRFFISFNQKERNVKARIVDISMGGMKCILDEESVKDSISMGLTLQSTDLFLKFQRIITDCKIVNIRDSTFSVIFIHLSEADKVTLSNVIFRMLSTTA